MRAVAAIFMAIFLANVATAHEWYTTQRSARNISCCGGNDCSPIPDSAIKCDATGCDVTLNPGDHVMMPIEGTGTAPAATGPRTLRFTGSPLASPDGLSHACITRAGMSTSTVLCLFRGGAV